MFAVLDGAAGHGGDVRARLRLRQREGRDEFAARDARQDARLQRIRAGEADRAGTQPLHREGEIGEPFVPGERLARQAERARIDLLARAAIGAGRDVGEQPAPPSIGTRLRQAASAS